MKQARNRTIYLDDFWNHHERITVTLKKSEARKLRARAEACGRTRGQQLCAESYGYLNGIYVPTKLLEQRLQEISLLIRNEANNLNQLIRHSHHLKRLVCDERSIILSLQRQEIAVEQLITKSWHSPRSPQV